MNRYQAVFVTYENLSLQNNWILLLINISNLASNSAMWRLPWYVPNFKVACVLGSNEHYKKLKHLRNLKKWYKFIKRSQIFLRLNTYAVQFELGNLQNLSRLLGHRKVNFENIFSTKKIHAIYHFSPLFRICHIYHFDLLLLICIKVWSGLEAIPRTSKREQKGTVILKSWWFFTLSL